ncbi:MAG: iron-sulfur cluster assembly accessory protein [candidate division Zixibacteria bacterium]
MPNDKAATIGNSPSAEELIKITTPAITEIKRLIEAEDSSNLFLRLGISSGGCSGMSYKMEFDDRAGEFDRKFVFDGLKVLVDLKALVHLKGCTIDFESSLMGGGFSFSNPNATRSCGCGSSFSC